MGRTRSLTASEAQVQKSIMSWGAWQKQNGIGMFRINVIGVPLKDDGGKKRFRPSPNVGMADIYMSVQTEGISVGVWLEVKKQKDENGKGGGTQSRPQKKFEMEVKEQKGWYFIVRSIEDVQQVITTIRHDTWKKISKISTQFNIHETGQE